MSQISTEAQRELRDHIETQLLNLATMLMTQPVAYKLCTQISTAFSRYAEIAQILTENSKNEETGGFTQL